MGNDYTKSDKKPSTTEQNPLNVSQPKPDNVFPQKPDNVTQLRPDNVFQQKPDTSSQQNNLRKAHNQRRSRNNSRHTGCSVKEGQKKNLNDFIKICDDFENALKTVEVFKISRNSVHQRLLTIHKILVEKISKLEKSINDNSNSTTNKKKDSSNLKSHNKSLSSSTSSLHSKKSSKGLPNLTSYNEFLKEVSCPFCDERQMDKYYLIKHLDECCLPFKMKSFKRKTNLPYSIFQILPKNYFKCNVCPNMVEKDLHSYFNHINSFTHEENLKHKCSSKSYSHSLFCAVCKFLVPNNFTELIMHLEHQQHKKGTKQDVSERIFSGKNICCIYYNSGEYNCIPCSRRFSKQNNLMEFMTHLMQDKHKRNLEKLGVDATKIYCEICEKEIFQFEMWDHFRSLEHDSKVFKQKGSQYFTVCVYCSSDFSDLTELANHMTSGCKEIEILRNDGLIPDHEASVKSTEIEEGAAGKEEVKDGHCVFFDVSDDVDDSDLKNFFENFGHVISFNRLPGNKVRIVFKESDAVNKILGFKKLMGNDSKILLDESLLENENRSNQSNIECESDEENGTSDDDNDSCDNEEMKNLFEEVGSHLMKKVETMDSAEDDEILLISQMTLKATITFSGFRGCQLFIPNEARLHLHCQFETQHYNSVLEDLLINQNLSRIEKDSVELNFGLSRVGLGLIEKSPFWEDAELVTASIPYVKCIHKRTRKSCIITFSDSDRELTDALSACLKENDVIKPFLLTLKLWLSCQKTFLSDIESPVIAVILFFLTSKSLVRPFSVPKHPVHSKILRALSDDDDLNGNEPVGNIAEGDISKLFQMFLEFLSKFDFEKYAICFPLPRPVPKVIVTNMLKDKDYSFSSIWIMNTSCTWNYTADIREKDSRAFLNLVNKTLQEI